MSDKAEGNYISAFVFIFIAVVFIAFTLNVFSIITAKRQLDLAVDQMVKQMQLAGGINGEADSLFNFLCAGMKSLDNVSYNVDSAYHTPRPAGMVNAIQLGTPFFVTMRGQANLGGIWDFSFTRITITAKGAGVSERYWK